jgi:hypothetical protein
MSAPDGLPHLIQTCKNLQKHWDELLKADEAEPASIGGGLYRLAYRGDGYDLFTRYSINREFNNNTYQCDNFIWGIAMLISSVYNELFQTVPEPDKKIIETALTHYNGDPEDKRHIARLGYTDPMKAIEIVITGYHKHYNEQAAANKDEHQIQIMWYCVFANVLCSMYKQIKEPTYDHDMNGDYIYKILRIYILCCPIPWHMGISEVHLLDSLCFLFSHLEHADGDRLLDLREKLNIQETNALRTEILSNMQPIYDNGSIFDKLKNKNTCLLPFHKEIASQLDDMGYADAYKIRSLFFVTRKLKSNK